MIQTNPPHTLPEANILSLKNRPSQKEMSSSNFQPSIFRGYVSFREGNYLWPPFFQAKLLGFIGKKRPPWWFTNLAFGKAGDFFETTTCNLKPPSIEINAWRIIWMMIPNLYMGNGCLTKYPSKTGCLEFQAIFYRSWIHVMDHPKGHFFGGLDKYQGKGHTLIWAPTRHPAFRVSRPKWRTRLTSGTSSRFGSPKSEGCSKHTGKTRWTKMTRSKQTKLTWLNFEGVWRGVCPSQILGETRCLQHVDATKKNKFQKKKSSVWGGHPLFSPPSKLRQGTSQYQRKSSSKPSFWRTLAVSFQEGSPVSKK